MPRGRAGVRRRDPAGRVEAGGRAQPSLPRGALPRRPITPLPTPSGSLVTVALPCGVHQLDRQGDPDHRHPHCGAEEPWEGWRRGSCSRDQAASTPPPSPRLKISAGRQGKRSLEGGLSVATVPVGTGPQVWPDMHTLNSGTGVGQVSRGPQPSRNSCRNLGPERVPAGDSRGRRWWALVARAGRQDTGMPGQVFIGERAVWLRVLSGRPASRHTGPGAQTAAGGSPSEEQQGAVRAPPTAPCPPAPEGPPAPGFPPKPTGSPVSTRSQDSQSLNWTI